MIGCPSLSRHRRGGASGLYQPSKAELEVDKHVSATVEEAKAVRFPCDPCTSATSGGRNTVADRLSALSRITLIPKAVEAARNRHRGIPVACQPSCDARF